MKSLEGFNISQACQWAQVSRAGLHRQYEEHEPKQAEVDLRHAMQQIVIENRFYGYRRVAVELGNLGWTVNHKRVLRLMRQDNLLCLRKHRYVLTTDSKHPFAIYPNLAARVPLNDINQLWVADITYIRLREEFLYLAVLLDAFSRRVVGWQLGDSLASELVQGALHRALAERPVQPGIVHHSDRGVQYCCKDYVSILESNGFLISMSRSGNPYDNAKAESFMKTLKCEEVYLANYRDREDAHRSIAHFLEQVYNRKRLHSALGYLSPDAFEDSLQSAKLADQKGAAI
jgi:transposase InsO family protein